MHEGMHSDENNHKFMENKIVMLIVGFTKCIWFVKKARGPLLKLMEQAQSGFGLLQDEEKFIRIMLHANADSIEWECLFLDRTP